MSRTSMLATALKTIGEKCNNTTDGLFGRVAEITSGGATLKSSDLDFEFSCWCDDDLAANEAEITVYNLSDNTAKQLKKGNKISITAGYQDDTGVIFKGEVIKVTDKFDGVDRITRVYALDDVSRKEKKIDSVTYAAGKTASYILKDLLGKVGLPIAVFSPERDYTYTEAVTVDGDIISKIADYAKVCGISTYINKGQIYARTLKKGDDISFTVETDTGLISAPEEFEEEQTAEGYTDTIHGYKFTMLLQHRMTTAAIINLKSRNVSGKFRVRKCTHTFNESEAVSELEVVDA